MVSKLVERSPLNYEIVAAVSALDPSHIISSKVNAEKKFKNLVDIFYERDLITSIVADNPKLQFCSLSSAARVKLDERFENFSENGRCLDDFYYDVIGQDKSYKGPRFVIKIVLIFSLGQASVESGFSINSSIIVENLHEESLVAQRLVYDSVNALGGIKKIDTIPIIKEMLKSVKDSNRNYKIALDKRKEADNRENEERLARKRKQDMIKEIEEKKRVLLVNSQNQLLEMQAEIGQLKMTSK